MARIIYIETSTALCSTALSIDGRLIIYRESDLPKVHASMTAVFIDDMLRERGMSVSDCDAVCVSKGPGSYTGLRVGVSTAKGLCFGANLPLISVGTLDTLVWQYLSETFGYRLPAAKQSARLSSPFLADSGKILPDQSEDDAGIGSGDSVGSGGNHVFLNQGAGDNAVQSVGNDVNIGVSCRNVGVGDGENGYKYIIPVIDARRMEVYTALFSPNGMALTEPEAKIIDGNSFSAQLEEGRVLFIGDAADKCSTVIAHPNAYFISEQPRAFSMITPATKAFDEHRFEDVAYFEPFYLKNFTATVSKKSLW